MRAIISVSDKTGVTDFAKNLSQLGFEIFSTGGTQRALAEAEVPVTGVSELSGFPEILDGRVKTLHPIVYGGILAVHADRYFRYFYLAGRVVWRHQTILGICRTGGGNRLDGSDDCFQKYRMVQSVI